MLTAARFTYSHEGPRRGSSAGQPARSDEFSADGAAPLAPGRELMPHGFQGVCHLLSDAAQKRATRLSRTAAVEWALVMAREVATSQVLPSTNPVEALKAYLRQMGADEAAVHLPGDPCETCIASQIIPSIAAEEVVNLSHRIGTEPGPAFEWASRIGAMVLAHEAADGASNPHDALSALVLAEYASAVRRLDCELAG